VFFDEVFIFIFLEGFTGFSKRKLGHVKGKMV
jgi:hypothetical protein